MTRYALIRLLLAVRQMNDGQFWALLRALGMQDQPEAMGSWEIENLIKNFRK